MINKGDIVAVINDEYIDFPGGTYSEHFVKTKHFYKVIDIPSNSGRLKLKNCHGKIYTFFYEHDVTKVKGA